MVKEKLKQYALYIIVGLFVIICLQTCKSCSQKTTQQFTEQAYAVQIDSLTRCCDSLKNRVLLVEDSLKLYQYKTNAQEQLISSLNGDKRHLQEQNKNLGKVLLTTEK